MDEVNPYQSPMASCLREDVALGDGCYSARRCPQCRLEVTFWAALKQGTPFRCKCPHCGLKCRVYTPRVAWIFVGICFVALLGVLGTGLGVMQFGCVTL